jgi:hypothetical protein
MYNWLIIGFLALVAMYLAALGARSWQLKRGTAVVAMGAALSLAVVTIAAIWPALTDESSLAEQRRLNRLVVEALRERDVLAVDVNVARAAQKTLEQAHQSALDRIEREVTDVHRRYRDGGRDIVLETPRRETASLARVDAIAADVQDLQYLKPKSAPAVVRIEPAAPRETVTRDLVRLRDHMAATVKTDHYDVEPYPARELVGGRQGKYYVVDMKNAANGIRYFFDGGKYVLRTGSAEFRTSLNTFIGDILGKMEGNVRYDLFVRGSADNKPYEGRMDPAHAYRQISYLRQSGLERYAGLAGETTIEGGIVRNTDLPNLRAAFMRDLVASTYPVKTPIILEGSVTPKASDRDRSVELILFVEW